MIQRHILLSILLSVLAGYQLVGQEDSLVYRLNLGTVYSADENLPLYGHSNIGGLFDYDFNELAINENIPLLAYSPLARGLLTGKYIGSTIPEDSRLSRDDKIRKIT